MNQVYPSTAQFIDTINVGPIYGEAVIFLMDAFQLNGKNDSSVEVSLRGTSRSNISLFSLGGVVTAIMGLKVTFRMINDKLTSNQRQAITHSKHNLTSSVDSDLMDCNQILLLSQLMIRVQTKSSKIGDWVRLVLQTPTRSTSIRQTTRSFPS